MHSLSFLLFGPYVSRRQKLLVWVTGLVFSACILYYSYTLNLGWVWWQYIVAGVISFDIPAGAVANNLVSVKRHWERLRASKKRSWKKTVSNNVVFAWLHIPYIIVMGFSFWTDKPIEFCIVMSALLVCGTMFVARLPSSISRAGAMSMVALSMLLNIAYSPPSALWWFMPLLVVKVICGFTTPSLRAK